MYSIEDIVKEKAEWIDQYDHHPLPYWLQRWHFLLRKLKTYSEIERDSTAETTGEAQQYQDSK